MDRCRRLHDALTVLLVPMLAVHPAAGAIAAIAWAGTTPRPQRVADARLLVPIAITAVVAMAHGTGYPLGTAWFLLALVLAAWLTATLRGTLNARDAGLLGAGASATATALGLVAVIQSATAGFVQVHPGAAHPNVAAGLGLALVCASATATRLPRWGALVAVVGIVSAIVLVTLTGSRGGWVGLATAALVVAALTSLRWMPVRVQRVAPAATVGLALLLVVGVQLAAFAPGRLTSRPADAVVTTGTSVDPGRGASLAGRFVSLFDAWSASGGRVGTWTVARQMAAERPWLGFGFVEALPAFRARVASTLMVPTTHPHNGALLVLLQGGTVLLTGVMVVVLGWLWPLAVRGAAGDDGAAIVLGAVTALIAADRFDLVLVHSDIAAIALVALMAVLAPHTLPAGARSGDAGIDRTMAP